MLIVVVTGGGVGLPGPAGFNGAPPPALPPPQPTAHSTSAESAIETRSIFVMIVDEAKVMPRRCASVAGKNSERDV
jgi:hypothetical protein